MFFCKTYLLALTLALSVAATPLVPEPGIRIPLYKRGSLTKPDGTFDRETTIRASVKVQKCIRLAHLCYGASH